MRAVLTVCAAVENLTGLSPRGSEALPESATTGLGSRNRLLLNAFLPVLIQLEYLLKTALKYSTDSVLAVTTAMPTAAAVSAAVMASSVPVLPAMPVAAVAVVASAAPASTTDENAAVS